MDESQETKTEEQTNNKPWLFKKGQSGNPGGRPKGSISLKEYARRYLLELDDDGKKEFMDGLPKDVIWKMSEGNPKNDLDLTAKVSFADVLNDLENGNRKQTTGTENLGQVVEDSTLIQDTKQTEGVSSIQSEQSPATLPSEQMVSEHNTQESPTGIHN